MGSARSVTIIVPVYGDWPSLNDCIASLIKYVSDKHTVLFVNDHGPDYKLIEDSLLKAIKNQKNFQYELNSQNLGFLKNCNNAVLNIDKTPNDVLLLNSDTIVTEGFLEEIIEVAYSSDTIGTVCPRSSDATIASIPLYPRDNEETISPEYSYEIYTSVKDKLPRYSASPVSVGFCFYVKREIINKIGLFDEIFGMGYGEEDDFCMRINRLGYISVIAHQAFVYHMSARSFTAERRAEILSVNAKILEERNPHFNKLIHNYLSYQTSFYEAFAESLYYEKNKKSPLKILIDLHSLPPSESTELIDIRKTLNRIRVSKDIQYTIATSSATKQLLGIKNDIPCKEPHEINEQFDFGINLFTVRDINNAAFLQRTCTKIVAGTYILDFIHSNDVKVFPDQAEIAEKMIEWADFLVVRDDRQVAEYSAYVKNKDIHLNIVNSDDLFNFKNYKLDNLEDGRSIRWSEINTVKALTARDTAGVINTKEVGKTLKNLIKSNLSKFIS
jgi:GT2 family glycosyltransferase